MSNIIPLTANNTINDLRLKVNEIILSVPTYDVNTASYIFSNTEIDGVLTVTDDIVLGVDSIAQHLANNYAHGVTVKNITFNANTGVLSLTYNDLSSSVIDLDIGTQEHAFFNAVTANTATIGIIEAATITAANTTVTGVLDVTGSAAISTLTATTVTVTGNTSLQSLAVNQDLHAYANTYIHQTLYSLANTIVSGSLSVANTIFAVTDVDVSRNLFVDGDIFASSNINVTNDLIVSGNTTLNNITVTGAPEIEGDLHISGSAVIDLNLEVDGGNFTSTSNTFNLLSSPKTLNIGAGSSTVAIGSLTGNTAIRNDLRVAGDIYITGQELNSTTPIFNLLNGPVTTITFGGSATDLIIGSSVGTTTIRNNEVVSGSLSVTGNTSIIGTVFVNSGILDSPVSSANYLESPSSVTFASNASTLTIGSTSGTTTIRNNESVLGTLSVAGIASFTANASFNSGNILSTASSVNVFPTSSSVLIGADTGTTEIRNNAQVDKNLVVLGDFTVSGNTTIVNTTTLEVEDKNIEIGKVSDPSDTTANGGGITLKGLTDKTILWDSSNANWTSSENWNIVSGKVYKIGNDSVLSATTLGSSVVFSSLTTLGTIATGHWSADTIEVSKGGTNLTTYTKGDIIFASANDVLAKLPIGLENQLLQVTSDGVVRWVSNLDGGDY